MRYTFKKGPSRSGQMRLAPTYKLHCDGHHIATLQCKERFVQDDSLWFWYCDGVNTAHDPQPLDICKEDALGHFKRLFPASLPQERSK